MKTFNKFASPTAFTDLLFNIVMGVAFMFMLAFLLINPVAKKKDIESKADYLIMLTWDSKSVNDIDLWMRDPVGNLMSFRNKDSGLMHLDRDDLGSRNDKIKLPNGTVKVLSFNREIAALRGTVEGWYVVNTHVYRKRDASNKITGRLELLKVNPYKVIDVQDVVFTLQGEEQTIWQFRMDSEGKIVDLNRDEINLVGKSKFNLEDTYSFNSNHAQEEAERWLLGSGW
jgi:hypothetical protein